MLLRCSLWLGLLAVPVILALACEPSKPPMTPDTEASQQLPDLDAASTPAPPPSSSAAPAHS